MDNQGEDGNSSSNSSESGYGPYGVWTESRMMDSSTLYFLLIGLFGVVLGMVITGIFLLPIYFGNCARATPTIRSPVNITEEEGRRLAAGLLQPEQRQELDQAVAIELSWRAEQDLRLKKEKDEANAREVQRMKDEAEAVQQRAERSVRRKNERGSSATRWQYTALPQDPVVEQQAVACLLYTSPSPRDKRQSRMPSSA